MAAVPQDQTVSGLEHVVVHVTGHTEAGEPTFVSSRNAQWRSFAGNSFGMATVYTNDFMADLNDDKDVKKHEQKVAANELGLVNANGSLIRVVDFAPDNEPLFHQTKSIDYGIVVQGTVESIMASGEKVLMKPGDICIQRGTKHGWRNPSDTEWARVAFVLLDIQHVVVGGKEMKEDLGGADPEGLSSGNDA